MTHDDTEYETKTFRSAEELNALRSEASTLGIPYNYKCSAEELEFLIAIAKANTQKKPSLPIAHDMPACFGKSFAQTARECQICLARVQCAERLGTKPQIQQKFMTDEVTECAVCAEQGAEHSLTVPLYDPSQAGAEKVVVDYRCTNEACLNRLSIQVGWTVPFAEHVADTEISSQQPAAVSAGKPVDTDGAKDGSHQNEIPPVSPGGDLGVSPDDDQEEDEDEQDENEDEQDEQDEQDENEENEEENEDEDDEEENEDEDDEEPIQEVTPPKRRGRPKRKKPETIPEKPKRGRPPKKQPAAKKPTKAKTPTKAKVPRAASVPKPLKETKPTEPETASVRTATVKVRGAFSVPKLPGR